MKKGTKHLALIIAAISIALIGLISLQVYLLLVSYEQKEQAFDRNVLNALNAVSQQIEKDEAASKIFNVAMQFPVHPANGTKKILRRVTEDSAKKFSWTVTDTIRNEKGNQMRVEVFHSSGVDTITTIMVQGKAGKKSQQQSFGYSYSTDEKGLRFKAGFGDSLKIFLRDTTRRRRGEIVARVVDKLFLLETLPLEKRVDLSILDSLIARSLADVGIGMKYNFRIDVEADDSLQHGIRQPDGTIIPSASYKVRLFPNDVISDRYDLVVFLQDKSSFVLKEMVASVILSIVFIAIIILSFIYVIRTILAQKQFGESVINFINNMTHEFKTPISTIALASEAIAKPETIKSKTKLTKYNSVIADENLRMKRQVDKILQMAVLEEGEFELKRMPVDMHDVIGQAVKNISLLIEQKEGSVMTILNAKHCVIEGDAVHLTNIIHNVLDNAIKYSPQKPKIKIITHSEGNRLVISVQDSGIGISKEHIGRIFEKYYRVPTGNTHDVKGFGLGLSYVKLIVEAHQGTVLISSESGNGTTVEIKLLCKI